ncbi:MAG: Ig-like domain-containing protein [Prevotellaceae bacterium]|nr:Ig-like domain-containing protein [Prevotellaceae bacterium]
MLLKKNLKNIFCFIGCVAIVYACANKGPGPTGGPKDETPPSVMRSIPENGSLNFTSNQIQIYFDENVSIENMTENIVISPPQQKNPDIRAVAKRVFVKFNEDLKDSVTYSISFGNAIVDLNEKNPLSDYVFAFSTGNEIDTLQISGKIINAEDLNPISGIIIGIYEENADSVFQKKPFMRIAKSNEDGIFTISNIKEGTYRIFGLGDTNRDYYHQPGEGLALHDSLITPSWTRMEVQDTLWVDSLTIDTVHTFMATRFLPDDVLLRYFIENKKRQYFIKHERQKEFAFTLFFNTELAALPELKPINFDWESKYLLQKNNTLDTLTYWLTDSLIWNMDTLKLEMTYLKTDSLFNLTSTTDTIKIGKRRVRENTRSQRNQKNATAPPPKEPLKFTTNITSVFEIYNPVILSFDAPLADIDTSFIHLNQKADTLFLPLKYVWTPVDSTKMKYSLVYEWEAEESYKLDIDSAAFASIYGLISDKLSSTFKIRSLLEYSTLKIRLKEHNPKAVFQLLDAKDKVIATKPTEEEWTVFEHIRPGDYYVRLFVDDNGNGKWDPGDFRLHKHPEDVFYYNKKLTLRANWEFEEIWDVDEYPLPKQKPQELIQNTAKKK